MKSLVIKTLILSGMALIFSFDAFGQTRCTREYARCVRACNATRDQTLANHGVRRGQIRIQLNQALIQCNVQFIGNPAGRRACRNQAQARAGAELAALDALNQQAQRIRIGCITDCRQQLRDCEQSTPSLPTLSGDFTVDCLPGGALCQGPVSGFCQRAAGACDDCWRSMCGGGEWRLESEVDLRSVTLVAVSDRFKIGRVLATSSVNGKRATLNVPRDLKLRRGEQLYFQFRPRTKTQRSVKVTIQQDRR